MTGELHHVSFPPPILKLDFWLYVWRVGLPTGDCVNYVGMTGDTGSAHAQSAANRAAAHLGFNTKSNALRRYILEKTQAALEDCQSLDFFVFGPVYPKPELSEYPAARGKVAALEKHLWDRMNASGYKMLNVRPQTKFDLDVGRWDDVRAAFQRHFPNLC
jgi:hypothetical protein